MSHVCCGKHRLFSPAREFFSLLTAARQAYRLSSLHLVFGRSTHI
jgi:hypothetical protein